MRGTVNSLGAPAQKGDKSYCIAFLEVLSV